MNTALVADIGGTNTRVALVAPGGRPEHMVRFANDTLADPLAAFADLLERTGARPQVAVIAAAGPVLGDEIKLTNRDWRISLPDVSARFGIPTVRAVNDFEAVAWSIPELQPQDVRRLGGGTDRLGPRVVLGPGTGLGVAALVPDDAHWRVVCSEGGHVSFGPSQPDERAIFDRLQGDTPFVSAEMVLSGRGLVRLYAAIHPGRPAMTPRAIGEAATGGDAAARMVVALFFRLLARFAGDLALVFNARGGVFIAGGVARRLSPLLEEAAFRATFEAHPPQGPLLADIPIHMITEPEPGMLGCAALASRLLQAG